VTKRVTDWPEHLEACASCTGTSSLYTYGARGYCNRCYRIIRRIETVQAWNRNRPETLNGIAKSGMFDADTGESTGLCTDLLTDEQFEIYRKEIIRQLKGRLTRLHRREEIRRHEMPVDALALEHKFGELLRLIRRKADYPRNASYLNKHFTEMERRVIVALLEEIIEQHSWRGIEWSRVWRRVYETGH
jgi:hypothetical protein